MNHAQGNHVARLGRDESRPYTRIVTLAVDYGSQVGARLIAPKEIMWPNSGVMNYAPTRIVTVCHDGF